MKKIMEQVMNHVTDKKAEGDLIFSGGKSLKMSAQNGNISEYKVSSSQILGVRVIKDGKVGISYSESLDPESLKILVHQALENAQMSEPKEHERILDLKGELLDEARYSENDVDIKIKTEKALELESKVKALDKRVVAVPYNSYSEGEYQSLYLSSKGRFTSYADKSYTITSSALLDDKGKKANFYDYHLSHTFDGLQWNKVIENSLFHARNLLEERSLPTGKYSVVFSPDSLKSLVGCFSNVYSAKAAMDKMNPWLDKLGKEVISKDLTITDDPLFDKAFRKSLFDSEGVERKTLTLVKEGELKSLCHNSVTANYFNTQTTGHADRGASSFLGVSDSILVISGKNKKSLPSKYLEVIQMDGLYSGANVVTGTFSVAVKGYVWENGEKTMTFGNITLSGNFLELLKNAEVTNLEPLASTDQSFFSVPLVFHGLSIAGQE